MNRFIVRCCADMLHAHESGTDNEAYGSLVCYDSKGKPLIGDDLPPIRFCPWCGVPIVVAMRPEA